MAVTTDDLDVIVFADEHGRAEVLDHEAAYARLAGLRLEDVAQAIVDESPNRAGRVPCVITLDAGLAMVTWLRLAGWSGKAAA